MEYSKAIYSKFGNEIEKLNKKLIPVGTIINDFKYLNNKGAMEKFIRFRIKMIVDLNNNGEDNPYKELFIEKFKLELEILKTLLNEEDTINNIIDEESKLVKL